MACIEREVEIILGCRNGVPVYKREYFFKDGSYDSASDTYSDGLDATDWIAGNCPDGAKDPEVYCFTNDGGATIVSGFIDFDTTTTPSTPKFYDFNLVELIGYTQISCSADWEKEQICREVLVSGTGYTIGDEIRLYVYTQGGDSTAPITSYELYYNVTTGAYFIPANRSDLGPCTAVKQIADVPNCAGTLDPKPVDEINATYILNQENKHTERLYDNVTATLTGTIGLLITGTNVAIDFSGIVATNRVGANYILEAGTGFSDVGGNPTRDYIDEPDGNYEVKIYRTFVYPEGRRDYLIAALEVIKTGSTLTVQGTNPVALNRSITYTAKEVLQDYCNNLPVGVPYLIDGTSATIVGTLSLNYREEQTERLGISDANNDEAQVSIERLDMVDFIDPTNAIHFTRIVERTNGVVTATYDIDNTGTVYTPTGVVLSKEKDQEYKSTCYRALVNGTGFTAGDVLEFNVAFDPWNPRAPHYINRVNRSTLGIIFEQSPAGITGTFPSAGTEIIPCEQYVEGQVNIMSGSLSIAGDDVNGTNIGVNGFIGLPNTINTNVIPGRLQSVTIQVYSADEALTPGQVTNELLIIYPDGMKIPAKEGSTEVFSIVKDGDGELIREFEFYATGTARAKILYTYIP